MGKRNRFDYYLIFFISLLAFGNIGNSLQPIRIVGFLFIPYVFSNLALFEHYLNLKKLFVFFNAFFIYITLSLFWTVDIDQGFKDLLYYICHISLFLLLVILYLKSNFPVESMLLGWLVFVAVTLPIAFIEIFFDIHLLQSFIDSNYFINAGGGVLQKKFASVTFGNYNTYVTVICLSLPFIFGSLFLKVNIYYRIITFVAIISSFFILFINASRGGIIASLIVLVIYLIFLYRVSILSVLLFRISSIVLLLGIALYFNSDFIFEQLLYRGGLSTDFFFKDEGRHSLFRSGFQISVDYLYLGGGVGSIHRLMTSKGALISVPHNIFLEISIQFGIFFVLFLIFFLTRLIFKSLDTNKRVIKFITISFVICFPIVGIINSGYLLAPFFWIALASVYSVANTYEQMNRI